MNQTLFDKYLSTHQFFSCRWFKSISSRVPMLQKNNQKQQRWNKFYQYMQWGKIQQYLLTITSHGNSRIPEFRILTNIPTNHDKSCLFICCYFLCQINLNMIGYLVVVRIQNSWNNVVNCPYLVRITCSWLIFTIYISTIFFSQKNVLFSLKGAAMCPFFVKRKQVTKIRGFVDWEFVKTCHEHVRSFK